MFANVLRDQDSQPGWVIPKTQKMVQDAALLNTLHYKVRVKWSNPGNGVVPSPTPRCSSYWKGSLRVTLEEGCHLYLLYTFTRPLHRSRMRHKINLFLKLSLTGLNSEFSFSLTSCHTKVWEHSLP